MVSKWYSQTMKLQMDRSGRLVVPRHLRDALGLGQGGTVDVSVYGEGLQILPGGRTARVIETEDGPVFHSDAVVTDDDVFGLIDQGRR